VPSKVPPVSLDYLQEIVAVNWGAKYLAIVYSILPDIVEVGELIKVVGSITFPQMSGGTPGIRLFDDEFHTQSGGFASPPPIISNKFTALVPGATIVQAPRPHIISPADLSASQDTDAGLKVPGFGLKVTEKNVPGAVVYSTGMFLLKITEPFDDPFQLQLNFEVQYDETPPSGAVNGAFWQAKLFKSGALKSGFPLVLSNDSDKWKFPATTVTVQEDTVSIPGPYTQVLAVDPAKDTIDKL